MIDHSQVKLGRTASRSDPRTLRLAKYLAGNVAPAPESFNWSNNVATWPMFANDRVGDCTCAEAAHHLELWSAAGAHFEDSISDQDVLTAYSAISGYNSTTGANDNGAQLLDVLKYWQNTGVAGHKIDSYVQVDPTNHEHVKIAISQLGGLVGGVALPLAAQSFGAAQWPAPPVNPAGDWAPGSWGGHAVYVVDYTADGPTVVSWGRLYVVAWAFWDAYFDEAWAAVSTDFLNAAGIDPQGLNLAALRIDLNNLNS